MRVSEDGLHNHGYEVNMFQQPWRKLKERNAHIFQSVTLHFEYPITFTVHLLQKNVSCEVNHTN
jgi:hypothetical protein